MWGDGGGLWWGVGGEGVMMLTREYINGFVVVAAVRCIGSILLLKHAHSFELWFAWTTKCANQIVDLLGAVFPPQKGVAALTKRCCSPHKKV